MAGDVLAWMRLKPYRQQIANNIENTTLSIHLQDRTVTINSFELAKVSPVFEKMLTTDMKEKREKRVSLPHVSMNMWQITTSIHKYSHLVTMENVFDVFANSHMYQIENVNCYCIDFLETRCETDHAMLILKFAQSYDLASLQSAAYHAIAKYFRWMRRNENLDVLTIQDLMTIMDLDDLEKTESELFDFVTVWLETVKPDEATAFLLFSHIKLRDLSIRHLELRLQSKVLRSYVSVRTRFEQELRGRKSNPELLERYSTTRYDSERVLLILGKSRDKLTKLFSYSPSTEKGREISTPRFFAPAHYAVVAVNDDLIVTGGAGPNAKDKCNIYDAGSRRWFNYIRLVEGRSHHAMVALGEKAYVVAGEGVSGQLLSSIEEYTREARRWTLTGHLSVATANCGAAVLGHRIVVVGGRTDDSQDLVQTFDLLTKTCSVLETRLPCSLRFAQGACKIDLACFLGDKGDLVKIQEAGGVVTVTGHLKLEGFGERTWFGLYFDGHTILVIGQRKFEEWSLEGKTVEARAEPRFLGRVECWGCALMRVPNVHRLWYLWDTRLPLSQAVEGSAQQRRGDRRSSLFDLPR